MKQRRYLFTNIDVIFDHVDQIHLCVWLAEELLSWSNPNNMQVDAFKKLEETMCVHVRHLSQDAFLSYFNFFSNCFSKIYVAKHDPQSYTTHHTIRGQQSENFAHQVVLPVLLLLFCTATALKVAPESFRFKNYFGSFCDFASQEVLDVL